MLTSMCTWSGIRCPSIISTPFHWQSCLDDLPQVLAVFVVGCLPSILRCEHDVVLAEPLRVREAVRLLRHGYHLPLGAGDLNNRRPLEGRVASRVAEVRLHPRSGWFSMPR